MKKFFFGFACTAAGVALAVDVTVATVDVTAIDSGLKNTVVAVSSLDLSDGGAMVVSNLVKTTNLEAGDTLMAFDGSNYECWVLNGSGIWERMARKYTISGSGATNETEGAASLVTLPVGRGIWLSRKTYTTGHPFYIYGQHTDTKTSTVLAGKTALVGNPKQVAAAPASIANVATGDKVLIPSSGMLREFTYVGGAEYDSAKWEYPAGFFSIVTNSLPTVAAGTGFWYKSAGGAEVTINW